MIKTKTLDQSDRKRAKGSMIAYLDCERNTTENWIKGTLWSTGVNLEEIKSMVNSLRGYGDSERYKFLAEFVELK